MNQVTTPASTYLARPAPDLTSRVAEPVASPPARPAPSGVPALAELDRLVHAGEGRASLGLSPLAPALAILDWSAHLANAPFRRLELAGSALAQWARFVRAALDPLSRPAITPDPGDHRFTDPAWKTLPFSLAEQSFLLAEEWWLAAAGSGEGVTRTTARIVPLMVRQWLDVFSPSNIPWLNPEVIEATRSTRGRNLAEGLRNVVADLRSLVSGTQPSTFIVGRDLAATPGKVVFRNRLMELIQYAPSTAEVRPEPVLVVPAWIMKYYILDLSADNSLIRYVVGQGHTVFAISWRNPDAAMRDTSLEDYRNEGVMAALDTIGRICGQQRVHACGYCLGGTLLAIAAAAMARDGDERLASVTLLAAQTDFTEAGELQLFVNEDQLAFLSDLMSTQGYLDSRQMAGAFQMLRSNDLVWSRAIRSYLLGVREHPNDLMAWNADGTRMPARMHEEYLRRLFLNNDLAEGRFPAGDAPVALEDIKVPLFVVGTEADHIAPWRSVYKIHLFNEGDIAFVLTSGGHNAGIVSEPGHPRRHFRISRRASGERYQDPQAWAGTAELREGSWWPAWKAWLDEHSAAPAAPPPLGSKACPPLGDAPGTYVQQR